MGDYERVCLPLADSLSVIKYDHADVEETMRSGRIERKVTAVIRLKSQVEKEKSFRLRDCTFKLDRNLYG